jgi:hypothetical protein
MTFSSSEPSPVQIAGLPAVDIELLYAEPVTLRVHCDQCRAPGPLAENEQVAIGLALTRGFVVLLREQMTTGHLPLSQGDLEGARIFCPRCSEEFIP